MPCLSEFSPIGYAFRADQSIRWLVWVKLSHKTTNIGLTNINK